VGSAQWLPRHYAGHLEDEDSGLVYMQARWMDPQTGTFLSVDPVVPQYDDPQSLNAYAYSRNNPVNATDPTGQTWYFVDSYVTANGMSVVTVHTNSAAAAGAAWFGPFEAPSMPGANAGGGGLGGLGSASLGDIGGASLAGLGGLGGAGASGGSQSNPVVDTTAEAISHYFSGNGEAVELGPESRAAIKNSPEQQMRAERIRSGNTPNLNRGNYGVDVTREKYFIGDTPVHYETLCRGGSCTTTFTSRGDGFWDVMFDVDGPGPRGEVPGGTPYPFLPFSWEMTFTDPRSRQ
jgi:RHS repeat-associated protein